MGTDDAQDARLDALLDAYHGGCSPIPAPRPASEGTVSKPFPVLLENWSTFLRMLAGRGRLVESSPTGYGYLVTVEWLS